MTRLSYLGLHTQFPHCDQRVLHAPGECEYCDRHPDWQSERTREGVCFTGHDGDWMDRYWGGFQLLWEPCPADLARPPGSRSDHRRWGGNKPTSADASFPIETTASQVMYGDQGGREPWPLGERIRRRAVRPFRNLGYWLLGYHRDGIFLVYGPSPRPPLGARGERVGRRLLGRR